MYFSDDHGGIAACLIGLVAIVFVAIGISLLHDLSNAEAKSTREVRAQIKRDYSELRSVQDQIRRQRTRLQTSPAGRSGTSESFEVCQAEALALGIRVAELRGTKEALLAGIADADESLTDHRQNYCLKVRGRAVGERLETLALDSGRVFNDVIIRGFDEFGLRIHHRHGSARVAYRDLPAAWRERLHWKEGDDLQPPAATTARPTPPVAVTEENEPEPVASEPSRSAVLKRMKSDADHPELSAARDRFSAARSSFLRARREAGRARAKSRGAAKSVPGSLETWASRAERLTTVEERARVLYDRAKRQLRRLSPYDPLLHSPDHE